MSHFIYPNFKNGFNCTCPDDNFPKKYRYHKKSSSLNTDKVVVIVYVT